MANQSRLTVGDVAELFSVEQWRIRRIVDALPIEVERAGNYRLIPRTALISVAAELERRGWLPPQEVAFQ